ncbi:hypothetical protein Ancab_040318 [Ancistrocladus abbreviatus]
MADELKLYGHGISVFTRKVRAVLDYKGLKYEYFEEDLNNLSADLYKYNPAFKLTPVLVHNGRPIGESIIIMQYIDERWPNKPLMPTDPYERAMTRFWGLFLDDKVRPSIKDVVLCEEHQVEKATEELHGMFALLEKELKRKGGKYFGGKDLGLLDICALYVVGWPEPMEKASKREIFPKEKFPVLHAWVYQMRSHSFISNNLVFEGAYNYYIAKLSKMGRL